MYSCDIVTDIISTIETNFINNKKNSKHSIIGLQKIKQENDKKFQFALIMFLVNGKKNLKNENFIFLLVI